MIEFISWIGSICFAICGIPQAIECLRTKSAEGLAWNFLILWGGGEICMLIYSISTNQLPLVLNYIFNGLCLIIIIATKLNEKKTKGKKTRERIIWKRKEKKTEEYVKNRIESQYPELVRTNLSEEEKEDKARKVMEIIRGGKR